jgi:hypothetical protein
MPTGTIKINNFRSSRSAPLRRLCIFITDHEPYQTILGEHRPGASHHLKPLRAGRFKNPHDTPGIAKAGVPWVIILNGQYILPVNTPGPYSLQNLLRKPTGTRDRSLRKRSWTLLLRRRQRTSGRFFPKRQKVC